MLVDDGTYPQAIRCNFFLLDGGVEFGVDGVELQVVLPVSIELSFGKLQLKMSISSAFFFFNKLRRVENSDLFPCQKNKLKCLLLDH